jgi:hypothetical protein
MERVTGRQGRPRTRSRLMDSRRRRCYPLWHAAVAGCRRSNSSRRASRCCTDAKWRARRESNSRDQLGRNLRAHPSRLGCARRFDLVAPRGTVIGSGLGPAKGPARLLFDLLRVRPGPEPGRPGRCGLDHPGRRNRRLRSGGRWRMRCRVIVVPSMRTTMATGLPQLFPSGPNSGTAVTGSPCLRRSAAVSQRSANAAAAPGHVFSAASSCACCPSTIDELTRSSARG